MRDIGLMMGVKTLWQEDLLWDYTIKVQGQEFKAHKVVLASVSQYFKAMLGEGFMESKLDEIELKGLSADVVSKVLEFIYTGDENIIGTDALEFLTCVMYLQMPLVADVCVEKLLDNLNYKSCLQVHSTFVEYSFNEEAEKVRNFIKLNWKTVLEVCSLEELSHRAVQVLMDYWRKSEWEMFLFIKDWYSGDPENHKDYVNGLMTQVRFCLISSQRVKSITKMNIFTDTEGSWHDLVEKALHYHQLPTHLKVLEQSDQSKVRPEPSPVFFTTGFCEDSSTFFALDEKKQWSKHEKMAQNIPEFAEIDIPVGIEVNNYFIIWTGAQTRKWHIFDPRTLKWSKMADMEKWRTNFVLLNYGDYLYTVGGSTWKPSLDPQYKYISDDVYAMEQYSFKDNIWNSVTVPYSFRRHGACVFGDSIYVSGGYIRDVMGEESCNSLYSLDLSSPNQEWEKKAPSMLDYPFKDPKMFVVCKEGEDVLLVVDDELHMWYYSPAKDQWTKFDFDIERRYCDVFYLVHGMILCRQNSLFVFNVELLGGEQDGSGSDYDFDEAEHCIKDRVCLNWEIPTKGETIKNVPVENFPFRPRSRIEPAVNIFAAILAIPH